jgi:hypothetical protein
MSDHEIRVHADELEYTSDGLRTGEHLPLRAGVHNRVVVTRPKRVKAVPIGYGAFDHDSTFPTPGVLAVGMGAAFENLLGKLGVDASTIYQFYGHAEATGDDAYNKGLSDRRARCVQAVFVGDVEPVRDLAREEEWGVREHQIMLRVLRCDPGAIDGEGGPVTEAAVAMFQREYSDGVFHRHLEQEPPAVLADDGKLNAATVDALIEAYVLATSPRVPAQRVHPTHPVVGCSEFNRVSLDEPAANRRIALVVHEVLPPFHDRAPCTVGDHTVCPLDEGDESFRCLWYREHVEEVALAELVHRHFDLRWLDLPNGKILLSALTTLPEGAPVDFQVFRTAPIENQEAIAAETLAEPLSDSLRGIIRGGVAQVVWEPPEGFDLYAPALVPMTVEEFAEAAVPVARARVPVFRVSGGGCELVSPPPGRELGRLPREPYGQTEPSSVGFAALDWFGRLYQHAVHPEERSVEQRHPLRDEEPRILEVRHSVWTLEEETE